MVHEITNEILSLFKIPKTATFSWWTVLCTHVNGLMKNCKFPMPKHVRRACQRHVNGMSTACQPNNELWAKHEWRRGCIQSQKFADCTQNKMPKKTKRIVQLFFHCVFAKNWQHVWTKITAWRAHWHSPLCSVHLVGLNPYLTLSAFLTVDENIGNWFKKVTPHKLQVNISSPRPCPSTGTLTGMVAMSKILLNNWAQLDQKNTSTVGWKWLAAIFGGKTEYETINWKHSS